MNIEVITKKKQNMDLYIFIFYSEDDICQKLKEFNIKCNYSKLQKDFKGKYDSLVKFYSENSRVWLIGLGKKKDLTSLKVRKCLTNISSMLKNVDDTKIMLYPVDKFVDAQVQSITMNNYAFNKYKSSKNK